MSDEPEPTIEELEAAIAKAQAESSAANKALTQLQKKLYQRTRRGVNDEEVAFLRARGFEQRASSLVSSRWYFIDERLEVEADWDCDQWNIRMRFLARLDGPIEEIEDLGCLNQHVRGPNLEQLCDLLIRDLSTLSSALAHAQQRLAPQ
jgi:hypothetical protein